MKVDIVTPDRSLFSGEVDMITLPGTLGQMGILRGHAPLLSTLDIGEIILHQGNNQQFVAVAGGVVEVRPDKVTILADSAESSSEIDEERAEEARARAEKLLAENPPPNERPVLEAALRRSTLRLKIARRHQGRRHAEGLNYEGEHK